MLKILEGMEDSGRRPVGMPRKMWTRTVQLGFKMTGSWEKGGPELLRMKENHYKSSSWSRIKGLVYMNEEEKAVFICKENILLGEDR